jgi:hypothetical protein
MLHQRHALNVESLERHFRLERYRGPIFNVTLRMARPFTIFTAGSGWPGIGRPSNCDDRKINGFCQCTGSVTYCSLNCYVDKNDYLYVADPGRHEVVIFDSVGTYAGKVTDTGTFKPSDAMVYDNDIWVANPDNHRLNVYDENTPASWLSTSLTNMVQCSDGVFVRAL